MTKTRIKRLSQRVFAQAQELLEQEGFACHAIQRVVTPRDVSECCPEREYFVKVLEPRSRAESTLGYGYGEFAFYGDLTPENQTARSIGLALVALLAKEGFVP